MAPTEKGDNNKNGKAAYPENVSFHLNFVLLLKTKHLSIINSSMFQHMSYLCVKLINISLHFRIYIVHDEVKDKNFELELSWVGESKYCMFVFVDFHRTVYLNFLN